MHLNEVLSVPMCILSKFFSLNLKIFGTGFCPRGPRMAAPHVTIPLNSGELFCTQISLTVINMSESFFQNYIKIHFCVIEFDRTNSQ